jgi:hypothetical protein
MLIVHGVYHFRPRRAAVRSDFCITCNQPRYAIQVKTIDVLHLFWIPVLPLGVYGRWRCLTCGKPPDLVATARRSIRILAAVAAAIVAIPFWLAPADDENAVLVWSARVGLVAATAGAIWWASRPADDVERRKRMKELPPIHIPECPLCAVVMQPGDPWRCPKCGIAHA